MALALTFAFSLRGHVNTHLPVDDLERTCVWRLEPPWPAVKVWRLWEDSWLPANFPLGIFDFLLYSKGRDSSEAKEDLIGIPSDCLRDKALEDEKRDIATQL